MSDLDYGMAPDGGANGDGDQRREYRLVARARVWLELESPPPEDGKGAHLDDARWLACGIRDFSAHGLSLTSAEALPEGALLPARVQLGRQPEPFRLMVEVVWSQPGAGGFLSGVRILESDGTACLEWVEAVAEAMSDGF